MTAICGQAAPGETCIPADVAMSESMRNLLPTVDVFGTPVDLSWLAVPALFLLLFAIA